MESQFLAQMGREEFKTLLRDVLREILEDEKTAGLNADSLINIQAAAVLLNLAVSTLYEKTSERSIPHYKHGKKILFKKSELLAWIESRKVASAQEIKKEASRYNTKSKTHIRDRYL